MTACPPLAVLACALLQAAVAAPGEDAFVELRTARATRFAGEEATIEVRFGFERAFLEHGLVPLFRRPLDVPAQLEAPWLDGLAAARVRLVPPPEGQGRTLAVNEAEGLAARLPDEERGGRTFAVFALDARVVPRDPGELALAGPALRFARASAFEDDLAQGRVAADPSPARLAAEPLVLDVRPLPEEGRPAGFTGAVGRFTVTAEAEPRALAPGADLKLVLAIEGEGDLEGFEAPPLELPGFHVRGHIEERAPGRRAITYDLAPASADVAAVPPVAFDFFDPEPPGAYRTARTAEIPLERLPVPEVGSVEGEAAEEARSWRLAAALGLALVAALAAAVLRARRSRAAKGWQDPRAG